MTLRFCVLFPLLNSPGEYASRACGRAKNLSWKLNSPHGSRKLRQLALLALFQTFVLTGCGSPEQPALESNQAIQTDVARTVFFSERLDVSQRLSLPQRISQSFDMPEIMGSGCSMADLNGDGLLELIAVPRRTEKASASKTGTNESQCRILSRQSVSNEGALDYADVTEKSNIRVSGVGMGCYFADIDNDGDPDAFVTSSSGARLYRNDGGFNFAEVTESSGLPCQRWCTAAVFFDYDSDGWLDLLVVNYVDYFPGSLCHDAVGRQDFCGPLSFSGTSDQLFHNLGATTPGLFEEVTVSSGLAARIGKGLGAICADFNGDDVPDIYVANDMEPNFLWIQEEGGRFREEASLRGCAVDHQGRPQASMGTLLHDLDGDGHADIFLTHLRGETNTLYRQVTSGVFQDETIRYGLSETSRDHTGFGVAACDLDLNGVSEIVIVNGRVMRSPFVKNDNATSGTGSWSDYAESNQVFKAAGEAEPRRYELSAHGDPFTEREEVSRGLAMGDADNDGDVDLLVSNSEGSIRYYENSAARSGHWLLIRVFDAELNREAIGAEVAVAVGEKVYRSVVLPQTGYLSQHDSRIHLGVGGALRFDSIDVRWPGPNGVTERFESGVTNQMVTVVRGKGQTLLDAAKPQEFRP